jgi:hypothetical protein
MTLFRAIADGADWSQPVTQMYDRDVVTPRLADGVDPDLDLVFPHRTRPGLRHRGDAVARIPAPVPHPSQGRGANRRPPSATVTTWSLGELPTHPGPGDPQGE